MIQYGKPNPAFLAHMQKTGVWFSARKTYEQQQQLAKLLMSEDGKTKRTWRDFKARAQSVVGTYNETWLKVEFNMAIKSARSAAEWEQLHANKDLYPNLKYLPSRAATPRDEHKVLYGIIRSIDDDFWTTHYPPNGWNCQCRVEPTDQKANPLPESLTLPAPGLDTNPGKTGELFNLNSHPYSTGLSKETLEKIDQEGERQANKLLT